MSIQQQDSNLHERIGRLEAQMDNVAKALDEIKQEIRELRERLDSWLKWILGFTFTSWLTIMASLWLKK